MTGMRELTITELDSVSGAGPWEDQGYHYCSAGSTAGGSSGMYPVYVECNGPPAGSVALSSALTGATQGATGGAGGGTGGAGKPPA